MSIVIRWFTGLVVLAIASGAYAAPKKTDWTISSGSDPSGPFQVIADAMGFFKKQGLNVTVKIYSSATRGFRGMLAGENDMANSGSFAPVSTLAQGSKKFKIVGSTRNSQSGFTAIVVRPGIMDAKGLEGAKVGIARGSPSSHMWFDKYAAKNGLKKFERLWLQPSEQLIAFSKGEIDAVSIWFPWAGRAAGVLKGAKILARDKDIGFVNDTPITFSAGLLADRDAALGIMKGMVMASEYLDANPDESAKIVSKAFNIDLKVTKAISKTISLKVQFSDVTTADLCQSLNFLKGLGKVKGQPDWKTGLDSSILKAVAPERVTAKSLPNC
ncbi:MAG: ABC transporter substrate-binding protein [Rhodospirillaceae bacterium]|nr:ABC transporter substrate-binding protein [Rhodospirillaceae bacterium]MDE0254052.1 ABC transporter substrate-binding protein [Rhodospirillaceae bacterium]MDE0619013.1 ABC transporter substrate-binding protein [Rhodospirillaceae bacterium]MYJ70321.1 ABC transporter substrate-binding protein [Rhodospirillaceae bacterium]